MIKKWIIGCFLINCTFLAAQEYDSIAWKYAQTITSKDLSKHLHIIASDEFEGRETGKKGQKKAMEYLIREFQSYGIKDYENHNFIQKFPLIESKNDGISLTIGGQEFEVNKDFSITPNSLENQQIKGELVFGGFGIEEEGYSSYENIEVKGKGVLIWKGKPQKKELKKDWKTSDKIEQLEKKEGAAVFMFNKRLQASLDKYSHYYKKPKMRLFEENKKKEMPIISFTETAIKRVLKTSKLSFNKLEKKGVKKSMQFSIPFSLNINKPIKKYSGENVLAYIPGTDKNKEVLVLTAHYDHIGMEDTLVFNGADDDGTGTVSLLEIAQAFQMAAKEGHSPRRSILIMPVSGEEKGLLGSKYYSQNPVFPLENTVANLNVDMIGRYDEAHEKDSNYIYLIGSDRLSQDLHDLSEEVNKTYMNIGLDYTFNADDDPNRFYYRSDHYNFAKNNIPVIFYFSGVHEDYHKSTDTVEKIDFEKTQRVAQLIFLTAWHIANAEERIKLKK